MTVSPPGNGGTGLRIAARDLLFGRVLLQLGQRDAESGVLHRLPWGTAASGIVLTGKQNLGTLAAIRAAHPGLVLALEPDVDRDHIATVDGPFVLPPADLFGTATLERMLDDQIEAGASIALTPTGHVRAGDSDTAKAVIEVANGLDRDDVVVRLPVDAPWLRTNAKQLAAIVARSRHPVALSLAHEMDPMDGRGVAASMRELTLSVANLALWRTDLSAIAHVCDGGWAGAVGFVPSLRHGLSPGNSGRAINWRDKTPHVLLRDHLRYMRGSHLQDTFASSEPPHCGCSVCNGGPLDRFSESGADRLVAHEHNAAGLLDMVSELQHLPPHRRLEWWQERLRRALSAHEQTARQTGRHLAIPNVVAAWAKLHGIAA